MMSMNRVYFGLCMFICAFLWLWLMGTSSHDRMLDMDLKRSKHWYYGCTQIYNESEHYLMDWLDHHLNVVGFKNICVINVGPPLSKSLRQRFPIAYVEKKGRHQDFQFCLSACFIDEPMLPDDLLMIHDTDEYLNVRKADAIAPYHDRYDIFHLTEIRYGYVLDFDSQIMNRSIRTTNLWRKPHHGLGEYEKEDLKTFFKCKAYAGWPACNEGNGKEMIRVGAIKSLSIHFHTSHFQPDRRYYVDMNQIRLNHYVMRTKQDAIESASKWNKLPSRLGQIALNQWFRIIYDDSIIDSKRLI